MSSCDDILYQDNDLLIFRTQAGFFTIASSSWEIAHSSLRYADGMILKYYEIDNVGSYYPVKVEDYLVDKPLEPPLLGDWLGMIGILYFGNNVIVTNNDFDTLRLSIWDYEGDLLDSLYSDSWPGETTTQVFYEDLMFFRGSSFGNTVLILDLNEVHYPFFSKILYFSDLETYKPNQRERLESIYQFVDSEFICCCFSLPLILILLLLKKKPFVG